MIEYVVHVTEIEDKALRVDMVDPAIWVQNAIKVRAHVSMEKIADAEIKRMVADPAIETIPADRNSIVAAAEVESAADMKAAFLAEKA